MRIGSSPALFAPLVVALVVLPSRASLAAEPPPASDDGSSRLEELNEAGARHYAARSYRLAIEKFIEAYAIDHDPNLLFNIARCYEELGETSAAIEKYEAFIAAPGTDADGRVRAESSLRALRQLPAGAGKREAGDARTDADDSAEAALPAPEDKGSSSGTLPWVVLGAGLVTTGLGATLYALGAGDHAKVSSAPGFNDSSKVHPMTQHEAETLVRSGDTKKVIGGIGLGLGGALLATSAVLLLTGSSRKPADDRAAVSVVVDPGPRHLALSFAGRF